jgi:hypothetical protein
MFFIQFRKKMSSKSAEDPKSIYVFNSNLIEIES